MSETYAGRLEDFGQTGEVIDTFIEDTDRRIQAVERFCQRGDGGQKRSSHGEVVDAAC